MRESLLGRELTLAVPGGGTYPGTAASREGAVGRWMCRRGSLGGSNGRML